MNKSIRSQISVHRGVVAIASASALGLLAGCPAKPTSTNSATPAGRAPASDAPTNSPQGQTPAPQANSGDPAPAEPATASDPLYTLDFTMNRIEGEAEPLADYRGKVVMVVNVASACGLTPQYEGLEALYRAKNPGGLVILGFPANNFGDQEPGSNKEIEEFCTGTYHVTFPMFEKISVLGDDQHPLYQRLSQEGGPPSWNFTKYLVDRHGRVVARFDPRTRPDDPALIAKIDELLAQ